MADERPYPDFEAHELDSRCQFYTGRLPVSLVPGERLFERLWGLHPDSPPTLVIHGRPVKAPRFQQAFGHDYPFAGVVSEARPVDKLLEPFLEWVRRVVDPRLNGLLVNWYDPRLGHYIGAHRDKTTSLFPGSPIVTVSLGGTRVFRLRPWKGRGFRDFPASHGSAFVLPYLTNALWTHEVPRSARHPDRRISVTARAFEESAERGNPTRSASVGKSTTH